MKRIYLILLLSIICLNSSAQDILQNFSNSLNGHCCSFEYSFKISGNAPLTGAGDIMLQGDSFVMKGNGVEIYCDGTTRWINDVIAEECYIEHVDQEALDIEINPALLIVSLNKAFTYRNSRTINDNGIIINEILLSPKNSNGSVSEIKMYIDNGLTVRKSDIYLKDGSVIDVTVSHFKLSPAIDPDNFMLNTEELGTQYYITDLR